MGLFSSSKSSRTTINEDRRTINEYATNNNGEFAGVSGSVSVDESDSSVTNDIDNSVEDAYNQHFEDNSDNSDNSDHSIDNDVDNSVEDSHNTNVDDHSDNSVENDIDNSIEDSYNTNVDDHSDNSVENDIDNSVENDIDNSVQMEFEGDFAANTGTVNVLDGGAIAAAEAAAALALSSGESISKAALTMSEQALLSNQDIVDTAFTFGESVADNIESVATDAIDDVTLFSENAIDSVGDDLREISKDFAFSLRSTSNSITAANLKTSEDILKNQSASITADKEVIAELARNTSLAGQDIVAQASTDMIRYVAYGLGGLGFMVGFGLLIGGRK